jgi:16S rRNA processing protein RimM
MDYLPIGLVVSAHGIKGEIKFRYYNEGVDSINYPSLFVQTQDSYAELVVSRIRQQGNLFIIAFRGLDTREKTAHLLRKELFVPLKDLPELEEDEYYDFELIGLSVITNSGKHLGKVSRIIHVQSRDILVVEDAHNIHSNEEILIPMADDYLTEISRTDGTIHVREEFLAE